MAAEVKFKYPQPFTWAQAMDLDVGTISQGTRLMLPKKSSKGVVVWTHRTDRPRNHSSPALS